MVERVLLVDDEPEMLRTAKRALVPLQVDVDTATKPSEALQYVSEYDYAVVVVDLEMPEMSGLELIAKIQQKLPHVTYMVVTGKLEVEPSSVFISDAVTSLVYKPWANQELVHALKSALNLYRERRKTMEARRVLLVEDNPADVDLVAELLEGVGWGGTVVSSKKLTDAMDRLSREAFSAVVLDLSLPDAHGLEALEALQRVRPGVPVVVLTGHEDENLAIKALQCGAEDYLFKWEASGRALSRAIGFAIERHANSQRIAHLIHYDQLTHLPSRKLFREHLHRAISRARVRDSGTALLFVNINRFHLINEEQGYEAADATLRAVADRLRTCIEDPDSLGKIGPKEFGIITSGKNPAAQAMFIVEKIRMTMAEPIEIASEKRYLTLSIGIAFYPENGRTIDELFQCAEQAMHRGKRLSVGEDNLHTEFYSAANHAKELSIQRMERNLRHALSRKEFVVLYQAQHRIADGALIGAEALIRWHHDGQMISPGDFIPLLEKTDMIHSVGQWVLTQACHQVRAWNQMGPGNLRVAVNVSARQLESTGFVASVFDAIEQSGIPPACLEVELTETGLIANLDRTSHVLEQLSEIGVHVAVDDFGTGYSSLLYLKRLPVNCLKIDRSFVSDIGSNAEAEAIAKGTIDLAHALGLRVVAEGVENQTQLEFLRNAGCDEAQGYLFGRPDDPRKITDGYFNQTPLDPLPKRLES